MSLELKAYIVLCALTTLSMYLWMPHWVIPVVFATSFTISWPTGRLMNKVLGI